MKKVSVSRDVPYLAPKQPKGEVRLSIELNRAETMNKVATHPSSGIRMACDSSHSINSARQHLLFWRQKEKLFSFVAAVRG